MLEIKIAGLPRTHRPGGLPGFGIDDLIIDGDDSEGVGLVIYKPFRTEIPTAINDQDTPGISLSLTLEQNHPNPFNSSTSISYYLPRSGAVRLEIFNILGQKVKAVYDGYQPTGWHALIWDGADERNDPVASGIFMYRVTFDSESITRKLILIK